jgi:aminoglycoside phosphotransferase (APT) family kinase protein
LIDRWAANPATEDSVPSLTHGDATTTNFVFPKRGGVVVVDWERLYVADPASDIRRLMPEITHSINQHGGSVGEAEPFIRHMVDTYRQALPADWNADAPVEQARFYRASSTLRITRNGWVSRLARTALVAQAMALLAHEL